MAISYNRSGSILALITPSYADNVSLAAEYSSLLAVRDFNARSSPYPGVSLPDDCDFELTITYRATENQTYSSLAGVFESDVLLQQPDLRPMVILGGVRSSDSVVLAFLGAVSGPANSNEIMMNMSPVSNADLGSSLDEIPYFSRTIPSNAADAEVLCRYLSSLGVKHLAVLYLLGNYGTSFFFSLVDAAPKYNIQLQGFSFNYLRSFYEAISDFERTPLRYVFFVVDFGFWSEVLSLLLDEAPELFSDDYVWIFSDSLAMELQGDATSYLDPYGAWLNRGLVLSMQSSSETLELQKNEFIAARQDTSFLDLWNRSHYPGNPMPAWTPIPSLFSLLTYDAVFALGLGSCVSDAENVSSLEILQSLKAGLNFTGTTGRVSFDETNSRRPDDVAYAIQSVLYSENSGFGLLPSVVVEFAGLTIHELQSVVYRNGSTIPPADLAPANVTTDAIPVGIQAFCIILTSISLIASVACGTWTVIRRNQPAVRASQPFFLGILCLGTFLVAFSSVFLTWQQPLPQAVLDAACMANPWFLSLGLTTVFSGLFAKVWRVHRLFKNARKFRRVTIRALDVLWPLAILLTLNVVILTVWTVLDPLIWDEVEVSSDSYGRAVSVRYSCFAIGSGGRSVSLTCLILMIAVNVVASLLLNIESYRARQLPSQFNESSYIAITSLILLEASVISIPILVVVSGQRSALVLVRSVFNFILCLGVLLPIFLPKFTSQTGINKKRSVPKAGPTCSPG